MKIELNGIYLHPLNSEELSLFCNNLSLLEKKICCNYCAEPITGLFRDIAQYQLISGLSENPKYWNLYTYWLIILEKKVIGLVFFKGKPNPNGEVEIGYGLNKNYEKNGYMTQAVLYICKWATNQKVIKSILAETKKDNNKSQNLLKRCGFNICLETEKSFIYKKNI